jgi:hypothetical protein
MRMLFRCCRPAACFTSREKVLLLFQFAEDAAGLLFEVGRATKQQSAFYLCVQPILRTCFASVVE